MPDINLTRVNGTPYSWTSCAHFFNLLPYKGVTAVTFKETREVKLVHAAQQDGTPLGMTSGIYKVEDVSFTMLRDSAYAFLADMTVLGAGSYGDADFTYLCQIFEPVVPPSPPVSIMISGCRITGIEDKQEMGSDELVTEIKVGALYVTRSIGPIPLQLWSAIRTLLP